MDKAQFWKLIEESIAKSAGDCDTQVEMIETALLKLSPEEIISFDQTLDELRHDAYRWDLWGAAYLINGGASDDGFEYFRCWLIAQGQKIYENALANPDSLADVVEPDFDDAECEALLYVAGQAYEALTGQELPYPDDFVEDRSLCYVAPEPSGPKVDDSNVEKILPRLWAWAESWADGETEDERM